MLVEEIIMWMLIIMMLIIILSPPKSRVRSIEVNTKRKGYKKPPMPPLPKFPPNW